MHEPAKQTAGTKETHVKGNAGSPALEGKYQRTKEILKDEYNLSTAQLRHGGDSSAGVDPDWTQRLGHNRPPLVVSGYTLPLAPLAPFLLLLCHLQPLHWHLLALRPQPSSCGRGSSQYQKTHHCLWCA